MIDNISPKMNFSSFKSPLSSPKLTTLVTSPTTEPTTIENPSLYGASFNTKESSSRKSSFSSNFNNSNSLFSPEITSPSLKNSMLEKRIEENKKILFSHDDKDFSDETYREDHRRHSSFSRHSKMGTNHHHNLFDDKEQSTDDIFEFIKHSKNKTSSFTNSLINNGYSSYSKNYHQRSNSNSSNSSSLKSPKFTHSKTNSNTNINTKYNSNSNSNLSRNNTNTLLKSPTLSSPKIRKHSITTTEYVEYDPLLSPHLKPKTPFSYNSTQSITLETDTNNLISTGSTEEIGSFKSPSISSLTPTLAASATTTMVVASANANSTTARGTSSGSGQENNYTSSTSTERMMKPTDPGVPIVIEHLQSTTVDALDTNKNAKPVLLDPLGAGVVHSLD